MFCLTDGQKYSFISFHAMNFFIGSCEETQCHVARKLMYVILIGSNRIYFVWFHNKTGTLENTFFSYVTLVLLCWNKEVVQATCKLQRQKLIIQAIYSRHSFCAWSMYVYTMNYILVYGNQRNETRSEKKCELSRAAKNRERTTSYSKNRVNVRESAVITLQ